MSDGLRSHQFITEKRVESPVPASEFSLSTRVQHSAVHGPWKAGKGRVRVGGRNRNSVNYSQPLEA